MAIEAPLSKYKRNNFKIIIAMMLICAIWFGYDGYFNAEFREKHSDANGLPDSTLVFNQKSPPFFLGAAIVLGVSLFLISKKKIVAGEKELAINDKQRIPYDSIQKIDKTNFDSKGFFLITHKSTDGSEVTRKISDRTYDNLAAVLDELVSKIS